jgi:chromosomal replication initiation ATPase DnaA
MALDSWLPVKFGTPDGPVLRRAVAEGVDWQIYETTDEGRALVAKEDLARRWIEAGLVEEGAVAPFSFGGEQYRALCCSKSHKLAPIGKDCAPQSKSEALACSDAFGATRRIETEASLHDAVYVERYSRLLPTYSLTPRVEDDVVFGTWLSEGVPVSVHSFRRLRSLVGWLGEPQLAEIVAKAGFAVSKTVGGQCRPRTETQEDASADAPDRKEAGKPGVFELAGRPELENFINEHIVDIIENAARYKALGIGFPSAVILHGPPGCGKTYAVERLVEYLGWPSFQIEASSVASPFIHETSKKVAEVFDQALKNAPSVLVIDEMEAFLADRQMGAGSSHHRVEEVAEFLRRIPEAVANQVLVVAMTNRIEMIDPAILRRGRFDHVVKVDMASREEVLALLTKLAGDLPCEGGLRLDALAAKLEGRPLSDVAFVIREAARLAARSGKDRLGQDNLDKAAESAPARDGEESHRKIGFV